MLDTRNTENKTVLLYRIKRILKELSRILVVTALAVALYLYIFRRVRGGNLPSSVRFIGEKIGNVYGGGLCRKFSIEGIRFSNYDKIKRHVERYCFEGNLTLAELKAVLMDDPWISKLYVQKIIPDRLKILVIEHNPFAIFTSDYENYTLMNELGEKISIPGNEIANFSDLFTVVGSDFDIEETREMFSMLYDHAGIARRVSTLLRVGNRRWDLRLRNNVLIKMPEDAERTAKMWIMLDNLLSTYGLDIDLEEIDLRIGGKAFLKYKTGVKEKIDQFSKSFRGIGQN